MLDIKIEKYSHDSKIKWDQFVHNSKNGVFLFYRNYMDYHSNSFTDFSLLFYEAEKLIAIMPANINNNIITTHGGLTYGGIITNNDMRTSLMLEIFKALLIFLREKKIKILTYKTIPYIYHILPAEEDLYALFLNRATLIRRDLSSTINLNGDVIYNKGRKWSVKKSRTYGFEVKRSFDFKQFMSIEKNILKKKYNVEPTHTYEEIQLLANRFPDNIKLFGVFKGHEMVAGVIVYESQNVAHTQYIGSTEEGKEFFAQDLILDYLIRDYYKNKKYFDFGISTENNGRYLNQGLAQYKESFGASSIVYDFYELDIK